MPISAYELNFHQNGCNLLIKYGLDGNERIVNELITQGGKLTDAIYGYALGGHEQLVDKLLAKNPELIKAAAKGYARAKNNNKIEPLHEHKELKTSLLFGFAQAGDLTQISAALRTKEASKYIGSVIEGLASTGQEKLLLELLPGLRLDSLALKNAAKSGHHDLVKQLLARRSISLSEPNTSKHIPQELIDVLEGYTEGRHFTEVAQLLSLGINPLYCLNALTPSGILDPTDAKLLISSIPSAPIAAKVVSLIDLEFGLNTATLDGTSSTRSASELAELIGGGHLSQTSSTSLSLS